MAVTRPGTVTNWTELIPGPDAMPLYTTFGLLLQTFPGRYDKLSLFDLRKKAARRTSLPGKPYGLRVWNYTPPAGQPQGMCAFFFLRNLGPKTPMYAMTVGLDPNFVAAATTTATAIYNELVPLCQFMATQVTGNLPDPTDPLNIGGLEILSESTTFGNPMLDAVYQYAARQNSVLPDSDTISPSGSNPNKIWPDDLNRWVILPPTP